MTGGLRRALPAGLGIGWLAFGLGIAVMAVTSLVFGDWYLIRQPWGDIGLGLVVWGLALAAALGVALVIALPLGWLRTLAVPGVGVTGLLWAATLTMPLSGACCDQPPFPRDAGTILYSLPVLIPALAASTAAILLPLAASRILTPAASR